MTSSSIRWQLTPRDQEILAALDRCPMEANDLLAWSEIFSQPFGTLDRVRRTLARLEAARQVRSWRFAMTGEGGGAAPLYYKLTLDGFRTLHQNEDALPPTKRFLNEISAGRHRHQQCLTKFIVKTQIAARHSGLQIVDTFQENTYRIETPFGFPFPDQRFTLAMPSGASPRELHRTLRLQETTSTRFGGCFCRARQMQRACAVKGLGGSLQSFTSISPLT